MNNFFSINVSSLHDYVRALRAPPFLTILAQPSVASPTLRTAGSHVSPLGLLVSAPVMLQQRHSPAATALLSWECPSLGPP